MFQKKKNYKNYYTPELRKLVEQKCARELSLFGYNFDGPTDDRVLIETQDVKFA